MAPWQRRVLAGLAYTVGFAAVLLSPILLLFAVPRWAAVAFFFVAALAVTSATAWFAGGGRGFLWALFWTAGIYLLIGGATYLRGR
jgi:hypothetical protein